MNRWKSEKAGTPEHDELMAAARHLGATQMAKAAYRFVAGVSYIGAPKGMIAESLLQRSYASVPEMSAWLRAFRNAQGAMGAVRPQDRPFIAGWLGGAERSAKLYETKLAGLPEGKKNYAYEGGLSEARALAVRLRQALEIAG